MSKITRAPSASPMGIPHGQSMRRAALLAAPFLPALAAAVPMDAAQAQSPTTVPMTFGLEAYGGFAPVFGASSSSGYFNGQTDVSGAWGLGATVAYKFGKIQGLGDWRWGIGANVSYFRESTTFIGTGNYGGFPVTGHGGLSEWDFMAGPRMGFSIEHKHLGAFFLRGGVAVLSPGGRPLGENGPAFANSAYAGVIRIGVEGERIIGSGFKYGAVAFYQYTAPASFRSTLVGENFKFAGESRFMAGLTFRYDTTPHAFEGQR